MSLTFNTSPSWIATTGTADYWNTYSATPYEVRITTSTTDISSVVQNEVKRALRKERKEEVRKELEEEIKEELKKELKKEYEEKFQFLQKVNDDLSADNEKMSSQIDELKQTISKLQLEQELVKRLKEVFQPFTGSAPKSCKKEPTEVPSDPTKVKEEVKLTTNSKPCEETVKKEDVQEEKEKDPDWEKPEKPEITDVTHEKEDEFETSNHPLATAMRNKESSKN